MSQQPIEKSIQDLLCQALETELGGVAVYQMAILCAQRAELRAEWQKYLEQTQRHVEIVRELMRDLGLDPQAESPGRGIVRDKGIALVSAMRKALKLAPQSAQVVAADCIVDAETKDHQNWQLIGELAKTLDGEAAAVLGEAWEQVEDEEDEHLYHTRGWCRELWLESLSLPSVMPPPEEEQDVKSALDAARLEEERRAPKQSRRTAASRHASREA